MQRTLPVGCRRTFAARSTPPADRRPSACARSGVHRELGHRRAIASVRGAPIAPPCVRHRPRLCVVSRSSGARPPRAAPTSSDTFACVSCFTTQAQRLGQKSSSSPPAGSRRPARPSSSSSRPSRCLSSRRRLTQDSTSLSGAVAGLPFGSVRRAPTQRYGRDPNAPVISPQLRKLESGNRPTGLGVLAQPRPKLC